MRLQALQPLKDTPSTPTKIGVFDIETINWTEPYALGFYDGDNLKIFDGRECIKLFLEEFLRRKYAGLIVYAHNGGKFDFSFILDEIMKFEDEYKIEPMRSGARILQIKFTKNKQSWILRDSMSIFNNFSLAKLTKNFEVESLKGDFDHNKINWDNWEDLKPEWEPYLTNDCLGLHQVMTKFEQFLIENFGVDLHKNITLAQISMRVFRKKHLKIKIPNYITQEDDIRKSYYGGRTEIFKTYGENLNYYDINSLYPYVMHKYKMPVGVPRLTYAMRVHEFGIAHAQVYVPEHIKVPVLPYRSESGKLIFPTGRFSGWWCTPELKKAVEIGCKVKIIKGYLFEQEHLFKGYIEDLYKIKQNSKSGSVDYITSKLLMNSLYGKFGQRRERQQVIINPEDTTGLEPLDFEGVSGMYLKKGFSQACHIVPAISSMITCYARLHLYEFLSKCEPYYCDTDSIITKYVLETSPLLGAMKLEEEIKQGIFLLPKMYALTTKNGEYIKSKGFAKSKFTFGQFLNALETGNMDEFKTSQHKIATPFASMRRNKNFVSMIDFKRSVKSTYDKREIVARYNTKPLNIIEKAEDL